MPPNKGVNVYVQGDGATVKVETHGVKQIPEAPPKK